MFLKIQHRFLFFIMGIIKKVILYFNNHTH